MQDYKNGKITNALFIGTLVTCFLLPPVLTTYFFEWLNLNPFGIIKGWHFNPFSADRGIPFYQTFIYLFVMWIILNVLFWGLISLLFLLFRACRSHHSWFPGFLLTRMLLNAKYSLISDRAPVDPWFLERIDVIKGPSSVMYGQSVSVLLNRTIHFYRSSSYCYWGAVSVRRGRIAALRAGLMARSDQSSTHW